MDPDELTLQIARLMTQLPAVAHAEFLEREAAYWRDEANRLRTQLRDIESGARDAQWSPLPPPEPPVGTQFYAASGERLFYRGDLGWYCGNETCGNCPCDWTEAFERLSRTAHRTLPGQPPTPAPKKGS